MSSLFLSPSLPLLSRLSSRSLRITRFFSTGNNTIDGIVVGKFKSGKFSSLGAEINARTNGKLNEAWELSKKKGNSGEGLVLYGALPDLPRIAVVGMGNEGENILDAVRQGAANGARLLKSNGAKHIGIDTTLGSVCAAAEGCVLGSFKYNDLKAPADDEDGTPTAFMPYIDSQKITTSATAIHKEWNEGIIVAHAQNMARKLAETPANLMTPSLFSKAITEAFSGISTKGKVNVVVRDKQWIEEKKMGCLLGVSQGSTEPPKLVEVHYTNDPNPNAKPLVFVGKGVTFDSGGISLKPSAGMAAMKGDMQGAAIVMSAVRAIAELNLPINVIAIAPLTENMPAGNAVKPGDVITAMNKKTVEVDNTDAEGRLILADALHYAQSFGPHTLIDIATLTGAIDVALGPVCAGVFTPSNGLWGELLLASLQSGERVWRMPLFKEYRKMLNSHVADICNVSSKKSAGACTAAAFLQEFVTLDRWVHIDIAGVMQASDTTGYTPKGMSGKQLRTLVEFARQYDTRDQKLKEGDRK